MLFICWLFEVFCVLLLCCVWSWHYGCWCQYITTTDTSATAVNHTTPNNTTRIRLTTTAATININTTTRTTTITTAIATTT
jgi:hypothetical protein